jgi:hypothetical protein
MNRLRPGWCAKKWGFRLDDQGLLQNSRFADDLLLVGKSLMEVENMLRDLMVEAKVAGLELHPGKT